MFKCPECRMRLPTWEAVLLYYSSISTWNPPGDPGKLICDHCGARLKPPRMGTISAYVGVLGAVAGVAILGYVIDNNHEEPLWPILILVLILANLAITLVIIPSIFGFVVVDPSKEYQERKAIEHGGKRKCTYCGDIISSDERICPSCGQKLYPPLHPTTHDKIDSLLKQINKQSLTSPPEEYLSNAQEHAWNRQVKEAALELGKVLLASSPKSEIHAKAKGLLKKMGYRF